MASSPVAHTASALRGEAQSTCAGGHDELIGVRSSRAPSPFRVLTDPVGTRVTSVLLEEGELYVAHIRLFLDVALERVCEEPGEWGLTPAARGTRGA